MKIVDIEQGTGDWHLFRMNGIGSSDIAVLMGTSPFKKTVNQLREEKVKGSQKGFVSAAMKRGKDEEPYALAYLKEGSPNLSPQCAIMDGFDYIRCSFDAIDGKNIFEIKTPANADILRKALHAEMQPYWLDQLQWQMMVADAKEGHLAIWDGAKAHVFKYFADEAWQDRAMKLAIEFWESVQKAIETKTLEVDYPIIFDSKKRDALNEYRLLYAEIKDKQDRLVALKQEITDGMDPKFMLDGCKIYQKSNAHTDYKGLMEDFGNALSFYKQLREKHNIPLSEDEEEIANFHIDLERYKKKSDPHWNIAL